MTSHIDPKDKNAAIKWEYYATKCIYTGNCTMKKTTESSTNLPRNHLLLGLINCTARKNLFTEKTIHVDNRKKIHIKRLRPCWSKESKVRYHWGVAVCFYILSSCSAQNIFDETSSPTKKPKKSPTESPSDVMSELTVSPVTTPFPSYVPSLETSLMPTVTSLPTSTPMPTDTPRPTKSPRPSFSPSTSQPSLFPTETHSELPSMLPTVTTFTSEGLFRQAFIVDSAEKLDAVAIGIFEGVMESYTELYAKQIEDRDINPQNVNTTCTIVDQELGIPGRRSLREQLFVDLEYSESWWETMQKQVMIIWDYTSSSFSSFRRRIQEGGEAGFSNIIEYTMSYSSFTENVTGLPAAFQQFTNENLDLLTRDLRDANLTQILNSTDVTRLINPTNPTAEPSQFPTEVLSAVPTMMKSEPPTFLPTPELSDHPTIIPSLVPTFQESAIPTISPTLEIVTDPPTTPPTFVPDTQAPTQAPTPSNDGGGGNSAIIIAVAVVVAALLMMLIGIFYIYNKRKRQKDIEFREQLAGSDVQWDAEAGPINGTMTTGTTTEGYLHQPPPGILVTDGADSGAAMGGGMISPTDSLASNQSLLSVGNSMGGDSADEPDSTYNLADEFDQYKDQNLEKMRTEVEGNLSNADGMMSHALTKALMDDDDTPNPTALLWGGSGDSMEIEASALCEVNDWLKRNQNATPDERRTFMQETLNKMVASVRHGVIRPEHASRSIHECAGMLGLPVSEGIPADTLIVTGMRKTVKKNDVRAAFQEFGEIDEAAVSSNSRGFGIVRFKSPKSVSRAMVKFRNEEIVVQDVAVMITLLQADGAGSGGWNQRQPSIDTGSSQPIAAEPSFEA